MVQKQLGYAKGLGLSTKAHGRPWKFQAKQGGEVM